MRRMLLSPFGSKNTFKTSMVVALFTPSRNKSRSCLIEFESAVPVMCGFHMAKAAMGCLEKHLQGCSTEDASTDYRYN